MRAFLTAVCVLAPGALPCAAQDWWKPYAPPQTERENVFEFTQKPAVARLGEDRYEIRFAVKAFCDVTVAIVDSDGNVVRHLASGVLGSNAPKPFQKDSLSQVISWNGKDDLDWYHEHPETLKVRVMLGLKPVFDKRIGGQSPKNLPGYVWGIAASPEGVFVFAKGAGADGHLSIRKFDHDAKYLHSLVPPPANLPEEKLGGMAYVEYEPGKRALHGATVTETVQRGGCVFPDIDGKHGPANCQPAAAGNRLLFCNAGSFVRKGNASLLHYVFTDGSTDVAGIRGRPMLPGEGHGFPRFALSPDGKRLYLAGVKRDKVTSPAVYVLEADGTEAGKLFFGDPKSPGADDRRLSNPSGIDCDPQGRVYVADQLNNRIAILSPEGRILKSLAMERPELVRVHQKTGAIYVLHAARVEGKSQPRLTKYASFEKPEEVFHEDGVGGSALAVDSWTAKPRLWVGGGHVGVGTVDVAADMTSVSVYEEDGAKLRKIGDFDAEARKEGGEGYGGRWTGNRGHGFPRASADPNHEHAYLDRSKIFDLKTGKYLGVLKVNAYAYEDLGFDKRGYMHIHFNPGFFTPGVGRVDTNKGKPFTDKNETGISYPEIPYDYGVEAPGKYGPSWTGILPVKDQRGAKYFQDGLGVNMRGDVAVESNIYYVPKMEEAGFAFAQEGLKSRTEAGEYGGGKAGAFSYERFMQEVQEREKRGEKIYSIRRQPGLDLSGGTVWVFDRSGELRYACAVSAGKLVNGVQIDEDGALYFVNSRPRMFGERHFLCGKGGTYGLPEDKTNRWPFTGTLIKTIPGRDCVVRLSKSPVPLEPLPARPPDIIDIKFEDVFGKEQWAWVEGAEWLYAGASPIVSTGCSCPTMRHATDWFKRTFVPEAYRHSIGVLDTAGNLILHIGQYGNFDSASGPESQIPVGGDGIGLFMVRSVGVTDNYLFYEDWGERAAVLKLSYHREAAVPIAGP